MIVVASGKGGTGKTTLATNLALYVSRQGQAVQYLDCDVEAPNGHLFLKPEIDVREEVAVEVPEVDSKRCTGCGKCGEICQYGAIVSIKETVLTFEQLCHSCGGCWRVCPAGAIRPKKLVIGEVETGRSGDVDFVQGRIRIGHVRTPSMIKAVKSHIGGPDGLVIIDAPPGTSCPVVESLRRCDFALLVTEPTPFGLHDLKLAVGLVRAMNLPFAAVVNRYGIGNNDVEEYCQAEGIDIVTRLPDDRRIAERCSEGAMIVEAPGEYAGFFAQVYGYLERMEWRSDAERRLRIR